MDTNIRPYIVSRSIQLLSAVLISYLDDGGARIDRYNQPLRKVERALHILRNKGPVSSLVV